MLELAVELAGDVTLQAPLDLSRGSTLLGAGFDAGPHHWVEPDPVDHDGVKRPVELSTAEAVQPVAIRDSRGSRDGGRAGEHGECRLTLEPVWMRPRAQHRRSDDWAHAKLAEEVGTPGPHERGDRELVPLRFAGEHCRPVCQ